MKYIRLAARLLVALVFLFSGFVKGIDPLGSTYKFVDYFEAFGMAFLEPLAFPLAILLNALEFALGFGLLLKVKMRLNAWLTLVFMSFFTVLTFILALYNPVSDCGCFGDALILTNWETFWKNLIIMIPVLIIFFQRDQFQVSCSSARQWALWSLGPILMLLISWYNYNHLPVIDFRPYNVGAHIPSKMEIPEGAPQPEYETLLVYEKDGQQKEFTLENLPDSTWSWVATENKKVKEGYQPPIHDFAISTPEGVDITDNTLQYRGFTLLVIAYDLAQTNTEAMKELHELYQQCRAEESCQFMVVTSSLSSTIQTFNRETDTQMPFYNADEITLKTIVRANPGVLLLKNGVIMDKWHYRDLPTYDQLKETYFNHPIYAPIP